MNHFKGKYGPLLIAEIGGNHEGNYEYANKLTDLAISTDVDYIKYQIYSGDTLVNKSIDPQRNEHFKKFELTKDQYISIAEKVQNSGMKYMASVWHTGYLEWLDKYLDIYKVGSGDLTAYPILKDFAKRGKPLILSTGLSTEGEILDAVKFIQSVNKDYLDKNYLALLQCTSMYPIPPEDSNLSVISKLKELTGLTIGYSDHTVGYKALLYAYILGAEVLEFHFTDTKEGKTFRDHKVSLTPAEVKLLIEEIKLVNSYLGSEIKNPTKIEMDNHHHMSFRRGVFPSQDIKKGHIVKEGDLTVLRPAVGLGAEHFYSIIGKTANRNLKYMEKLDLTDFS